MRAAYRWRAASLWTAGPGIAVDLHHCVAGTALGKSVNSPASWSLTATRSLRYVAAVPTAVSEIHPCCANAARARHVVADGHG